MIFFKWHTWCGVENVPLPELQNNHCIWYMHAINDVEEMLLIYFQQTKLWRFNHYKWRGGNAINLRRPNHYNCWGTPLHTSGRPCHGGYRSWAVLSSSHFVWHVAASSKDSGKNPTNS
jgi:hypothetical protein